MSNEENVPEINGTESQVEQPKATFKSSFVANTQDVEDLPLSSLNENTTTQRLNDLGKALEDNESISNEEKSKILEIVSNALRSATPGDIYINLFDKPTDQEWQQLVEADGKKMFISSFRAKPKAGDKLGGKAAIALVNSILGSGLETRIPLYNSGIVVTISGIKETETMERAAILASTRSSLGFTMGTSLFSVHDSRIINDTIDWILEHVTATSVKGASLDTLRGLILVSDVPALMLGALQSMYPNGYPINHTCVEVVSGKCDYFVPIEQNPETGLYKAESMLNFGACLWVDNHKLSMEDRRIITAEPNTVTVEEVMAYQKRHLPTLASGPINENGAGLIRIKFRHPTLRTYRDETRSWLSEAEGMAQRIMTEAGVSKPSENQRRSTLNQARDILALRANMAWVGGILVDSEDETITIEDAEAVEEIVSSFRNTGVAKNFMESIEEFKEGATISVVGMTNYKCPKCGSGQTDPESKYPSVIPFNPFSYFFVIGVSRLARQIES